MMGVALPDPPSSGGNASNNATSTADTSTDNAAAADVTMTPRATSPAAGSTMVSFPRATLTCRPNSHPFQDRSLSLDQSIKVGRSVARARPAAGNAIFDCKVLSRNHALLWYESGKFYLQDTKSSNGTFVNNQRLSKGSEESLPREVCSGDILQFGVDVMENSRKVTHGCIIATLKLYLPDGKEAKASPTIMSSAAANGGHIPPQDLYQLNQYIQDALAREQLLETKLAVLQRLVGQTEVASHEAWSSLIDEDRLLTRVEILESQLSAYNKGMTEDKLREETHRLMEEKEEYQELAKGSLKKLMDEKLVAEKKLKDVEKQLSTTEDEFASLKELHDKDVDQTKKLAEELGKLTDELEEVKKKIPAEEETKEEEAAEGGSEEQQDRKSPSEEIAKTDEEVKAADSAAVTKEDVTCTDGASVDAEESAPAKAPPVAELEKQLTLRTSEFETLQGQYNELQEANKRLTATIEEMQESAAKTAAVATTLTSAPSSDSEEISRLQSLVESLQADLQSARDELSEASMKTSLSSNVSTVVLDESGSHELLSASLAEAEEKITQLLKVKERFAEVTQDKAQLEDNLGALEREVENLSAQSHTTTACALVPLVVLVLSIMVAYLPTLAAVFGTADRV